MHSKIFYGAAFAATIAVAGCSNSNPTPTSAVPSVAVTAKATAAPSSAPTAVPTSTPTTAPTATATPSAAPSAQPQVVHVGFTHTSIVDPTFGEIAYYAPNSGPAAVIDVKAGSSIVFMNDGSGVPHTASGLGSSGFPASFDNTNGPTAFGSTIDGGTTWSSGNLNPGQTSSVFTVGPPGTYYFGCAYHFPATPSMRDVIVAN